MIKRILYIVALFLWIGIQHPVIAEDSTKVVMVDTGTEISERSFDRERLKEAKENPDFQYDLKRKIEEPTFLDKIMYRIIRFILNIILQPTGSAESIIFYIICIILVVALILIIMRMNSIGIFSRRNSGDRSGLDFAEFTEDINTIDFDKMIEEAVNSGMFRRAVRLYYLKALKQLSDKSQIEWEINKTNRDYMYELKNAGLRAGFEEITYVYEYVWYGNVEIDAAKFSKVRSTFNQFSSQTAAAR